MRGPQLGDQAIEILSAAQMMRFATRVAEAPGESPVRARLAELARMIGTTAENDREVMQQVTQRLFSAGDGDRLRKDEQHVYQFLVDDLRSAQARGEIRGEVDCAQLAEMIAGVWFLTASNWLSNWWGQSETDLSSRLIGALDLLFDGCRAPAGRDGSAAL